MNHVSLVAARGYKGHIERIGNIARFHRRAQLPADYVTCEVIEHR